MNAVLRKVVVAQDLSRAERLNHPAWLLARWTERYGEEATEAWCARNNEPPPLTVVARDPALVDHWRGEGLDIAPAVIDGEALSGTWQIGDFEGPVPSLSGYDGGGFWVQDAAAVAVADLCGDVQDRVVLDACAAPGGKTLRLASRGARVFAVDRSHTRLARIRANLERMALSVEQLQPHDWDQGPLPGGLVADVVLVDAPCSSLGTLRRHPEIRWRRQEVDLDAMVPSQLGILRAASAHVAPGGVLIYAVCSPEPEEGEAVVDAFLSQHPAFSPTGGLTTAPPTSGEDAHQAFRLTRTEQ